MDEGGIDGKDDGGIDGKDDGGINGIDEREGPWKRTDGGRPVLVPLR